MVIWEKRGQDYRIKSIKQQWKRESCNTSDSKMDSHPSLGEIIWKFQSFPYPNVTFIIGNLPLRALWPLTTSPHLLKCLQNRDFPKTIPVNMWISLHLKSRLIPRFPRMCLKTLELLWIPQTQILISQYNSSQGWKNLFHQWKVQWDVLPLARDSLESAHPAWAHLVILTGQGFFTPFGWATAMPFSLPTPISEPPFHKPLKPLGQPALPSVPP